MTVFLLKPAAVAAEAADLIESGGWLQGRCSDGTGAFCTWGAIVAVVSGDPTWYDRGTLAASSLGAEFVAEWLADTASLPYVSEDDDYASGRIAVWNDAPVRTRDEVLALLRRS